MIELSFNENESVVLSVQVDFGHVGQWMNGMVDVLAKQGFESVSSFIAPLLFSFRHWQYCFCTLTLFFFWHSCMAC